MRIWFAWANVSRTFGGQRAVLMSLYHEALGFSKELPYLQRYVNTGERIINKRYADGLGQSQECEILERHVQRHADHAFFVQSTSERAAESLIYSVDSIIKYAGAAAHIAGKSDENLRGGRFLARGLTLLEAFRVVANWQRHDLEWRTTGYNDKNFNHRALRKLGLWAQDGVPIKFLRMLRRTAYFQLEREIMDALEYLVCEIGMRKPTPEQSQIDHHNSSAQVAKRAQAYAKEVKTRTTAKPHT